MKGILADVNITGQVRLLVETFYSSEEWAGFWNALELPCLFFDQLGLDPRATDDIVWQTCQDLGLVLITGNRNDDDPTSLEATIRDRLQPHSLPVVTVSQPKSLGLNAAYTAQAGIELLEILIDIDRYRGTGRLYVP